MRDTEVSRAEKMVILKEIMAIFMKKYMYRKYIIISFVQSKDLWEGLLCIHQDGH